MDGFLLKMFVWVLQHIILVSRTIDIDTIDIDWYRGMNGQNNLEAATEVLGDPYYKGIPLPRITRRSLI